MLLTIGANDINFSGLVADVIIEAAPSASLFRRGGAIATVEEAQQVLDRELPPTSRKLRAALKPLVGGNLSRVVFVSYGNPALAGRDTPCPGGRDGFDVHPAFGADGERLRQTSPTSWRSEFLPGIKALARCEPGKSCRDPATDRMTFVDAHQAAFAAARRLRARRQRSGFDRECFSPKGESFSAEPVEGRDRAAALQLRRPSEFRPYAPRARWIRTANDSYFTAMTYPEGLPALLQPSDLHDAIWGICRAVYGGAVHPTAEGHAAMADAALPAVREVLALPPTSKVPVFAEPLDPAPLPQDAPARRMRQPEQRPPLHARAPVSRPVALQADPIGSRHAELLLQAGRRRRVLEHQPLVRIDVAVRLLRHQRALVEAGQDQLELARIGVDVADGEDAGHAGLERRRCRPGSVRRP